MLTPSFVPRPCPLPGGAERSHNSLTSNTPVIKCAACIQDHLVSMLLVPSQSATDSCTQYKIKSLEANVQKSFIPESKQEWQIICRIKEESNWRKRTNPATYGKERSGNANTVVL